MATQKQVEKLKDAMTIGLVTKSQFDKAMSNHEYCYKLIGAVMLEARKKLIFAGYNGTRVELAQEAIKYMY